MKTTLILLSVLCFACAVATNSISKRCRKEWLIFIVCTIGGVFVLAGAVMLIGAIKFF